MATQSDFKVEVPESITRSIKEPEIEKYEFKKEEVRQRNVLEEIGHRMLDQSKKEIQKPQESIAPERTPTVPSKEIQRPQESIAPRREPTPEPAIREYLNNEANVFHRDRQVLENSKHLNFVRRVLIPESNPLALEGRDPETGETYIETHKMSADIVENGPLRGNWIVYPTIVEEEQGRLKRLDHRSGEAMRYALRTGEFINFGGRENEAIDFSRDYKSSIPRFNEYFKDRWETRQEEKEETPTVSSTPRPESPLSPSMYTGISSEESIGSRFIPPPVAYVWNSLFTRSDKTGENLGEDVVNELNLATANALRDGRMSVNYEDYGKTKRGLSLLALVGADKYKDGSKIPPEVRQRFARERHELYPFTGNKIQKTYAVIKFLNDVRTDPKMRAALTIGGFSIRENEDGSLYLKDKFNFNNKNITDEDVYVWFRKIISHNEKVPVLESEGFFTTVQLDTPDSLLNRPVGGGG